MISDVITNRERGFTSAVVLTAWVILIAGLCAILAGQIADFGFFQRTESFHGPFERESSQTSQSFVLALGKNSRFETLFNTSGDTLDDPYRSNLRLWINGQPAGPAHTIHEEIRKQGGGRYSHWGDTLLFSLPADTTNETSTTVAVEYSPRIETRIYTLGWLALVLSATSLAFRSWRLHPESLRRKGELLTRSAAAVCLALYGAAAVATATEAMTPPMISRA